MSRQRHKSRQLLLQSLYQLELSDNQADAIEEHSKTSEIYKQTDNDYFHSTFQGIISELDELNNLIAEISKGREVKLDPIMRAIILIGLYELKHYEDLAHAIIIKEAILLCKEFMHEDSHTFANAFLDQAARHIRGTAQS